MLLQLEKYLLSAWKHLPNAGPTPKYVSFLGQATGVSKACFFVFADDERSPRYIAKLPRSPVYNEELLREIVTIERLRATVPSKLQSTIPGPMHTVQLSGHWVVIEPVLPGRPMDSLLLSDGSLDPAATATQIALAHQWLIEMQREVPHRNGRMDATTIQQHFIRPVTTMQVNNDLTANEALYVERLVRDLRALEGHVLPLYLYHGDFRPGNILVERDRIAVLDWQFSRPLAPPLLDWFSFVFRLYSGSVRLPDMNGSLQEYRAVLHQVFFARNWFSELIAEYTKKYCEALRIDQGCLSILFGLFVVNNVNHFHRFLSDRATRGYLYLLGGAPTSCRSWKEQVRRQAYVWLLGEISSNPTLWPSSATKCSSVSLENSLQ